MRPLELRLRNFRSYFGETTFDLRDRALVGIVGPIGSGKSSILDAVAFALYGKTPAGGAATKALIHQRAADAAVALRFELENDVWEAVRSLRIKGAGQHALYRYESDGDDFEPVERITMEADVTKKIIELLGLDFDAFGRSVLLAQGRFAEFLQAPPAARDEVLKGVFGHDRLTRMRQLAKQRSNALHVDLEKLAVRVEQVERVAARLADRRQELATVGDRLEALRKAEPKVTDLTEQRNAAADRRKAAADRLGELAEHGRRLPDAKATKGLIAEATGAADRRRELAKRLEVGQAKAKAGEEAVAAAEREGVPARLDAAAQGLASAGLLAKAADEARRRQDAVAKRVATLTQQLETARVRCGTAAEASLAAEAAARAAAEALATAEAELHETRHRDMATALRAGLHRGESCPVCMQTVADIPTLDGGANLKAAEEAVIAARAGKQGADQTLIVASSEAQSAVEALASLEASQEGLINELTAAETGAAAAVAEAEHATRDLTGLLGAGEPAERLADLKDHHEQLVAAAAAARKDVDRIRGEHDAAIRTEQDTARLLDALRIDLADLAARLDAGIVVDGGGSPQALGTALDRLRSAWQEETTRLQSEHTAAESATTAATEARDALLAELGVTGDLTAELAKTGARSELVREEVARDQSEVDAAEALLAERAALDAEKGRFDRLASDLTNSKFVRYLLDDERARLAALGTRHFLRLSSGRYEFSDDGVFDIVDLTAADATRKPDSLSGGETFLASLALALALAEMVTRVGGRLDAFFLDEGFGTLDPEHLDLAMEGIEALVADGPERLVVVVSHVPELRQRLEDLIILDRNPITGDTRVVSG
jgi:exonuclease SbcC